MEDCRAGSGSCPIVGSLLQCWTLGLSSIVLEHHKFKLCSNGLSIHIDCHTIGAVDILTSDCSISNLGVETVISLSSSGVLWASNPMAIFDNYTRQSGCSAHHTFISRVMFIGCILHCCKGAGLCTSSHQTLQFPSPSSPVLELLIHVTDIRKQNISIRVHPVSMFLRVSFRLF